MEWVIYKALLPAHGGGNEAKGRRGGCRASPAPSSGGVPPGEDFNAAGRYTPRGVMIPGMPGGRFNPRQAQRMLKQMGISSQEVEGVEEVIIRTKDRELVIKGASVTMVNVQGQTMFQVAGEPEERARGTGGSGAAVSIPEEDVRLVAEKAGVSEERARQALVECNGEPAEAIIKLMGG